MCLTPCFGQSFWLAEACGGAGVAQTLPAVPARMGAVHTHTAGAGARAHSRPGSSIGAGTQATCGGPAPALMLSLPRVAGAAAHSEALPCLMRGMEAAMPANQGVCAGDGCTSVACACRIVQQQPAWYDNRGACDPYHTPTLTPLLTTGESGEQQGAG